MPAYSTSSAAVASIAGLLLGGLLYGFVGPGVFVIAAVLTGTVILLSAALPQTQQTTTDPAERA